MQISLSAILEMAPSRLRVGENWWRTSMNQYGLVATLAIGMTMGMAPDAHGDPAHPPSLNFVNDSDKTVLKVRFETTAHRTRHILKAPTNVTPDGPPGVPPGRDLHLDVTNLSYCIYTLRFVFEDGTMSEKFADFDLCHGNGALHINNTYRRQVTMFT